MSLKERRDELQEAFTMNQGENKRLAVAKLGVVVRSIGCSPKESELVKLEKDLSSRGQTSLDLAQVEQIVSSHNWAPESFETLVEALQTFDHEGNGYVSTTEVRHVLTTLGEKLTDEEVDEMIREVDLTGDGMFGCEDLAKKLTLV